MDIAAIVLAAGYGTRMKSQLPKVLHPVGGRPMIEWAVGAAESVSTLPPTVVVGHGREQIETLLADRVNFVLQEELLGTGHATQQAQPLLKRQSDAILVMYGDTPLLRTVTLQRLIDLFKENREQGSLAMSMLTVQRDDPQGFGRIARDEQGEILAIVEEVDCTPEQRMITELNPGIYCFDAEWLWSRIADIPLSAKGEYYLTDMVALAVADGRRIVTTPAPMDEVNGVNTRVQLAQLGSVLYQRVAERHMVAGVTIIDPNTTYIDDTVEIGQDTTILPGTMLQGDTKIGAKCTIGPHTQIVDSTIGDECRVTYSSVEMAQMEEHCEIGPFGHLRKGAHLAVGVHMGNFGEVKNSYLGAGTKMGHFSYIGDAQIDENVNIGAGTITCNYDGANKHPTIIGKNTFIGSDTLLVAPVNLGKNAQTGAGAIVTKDVPDDTLVYGVPARPK